MTLEDMLYSMKHHEPNEPMPEEPLTGRPPTSYESGHKTGSPQTGHSSGYETGKPQDDNDQRCRGKPQDLTLNINFNGVHMKMKGDKDGEYHVENDKKHDHGSK